MYGYGFKDGVFSLVKMYLGKNDARSEVPVMYSGECTGLETAGNIDEYIECIIGSECHNCMR